MLKIEKRFTTKSPSVAKGITDDLLSLYNTLSVKKTRNQTGYWTVIAILVGPYSI
jgi:hypothetical protein